MCLQHLAVPFSRTFEEQQRMKTIRIPSKLGFAGLLAGALGCLPAWADTEMTLAARTDMGSTALPAAQALSLDELVRVVLAYNPDLQQAVRAKEQAQAATITARALPNPSIELMQGRQRPLLNGLTGNVNGYGVSQLIENPAVRSARSDAAQFGLQSSGFVLDLTRAEVVARTRLRAFELLLRAEEARAAADELNLLEQIRDRVKVRVESGEAPRYEAIKAEAEFVTARQRQQTAALAVEQARIRINQLAAGQLPMNWRLAADLNDTPAFDAGQPIKGMDGLSRNPEIKALQSEVQRLQSRFDEVKASVFPGVELRYNTSKEPDNRQNVLGAVIQVPLLDQKQGPKAEVTAAVMQAKARLEGRQAELKLQLDSALTTLEMAKLREEALSQGAMRNAEAALQVAQAAYRFGERGILDVLDAQRVLRGVRADLLQARYQKHAAAIEIELLTGQQAYAAAKPNNPSK